MSENHLKTSVGNLPHWFDSTVTIVGWGGGHLGKRPGKDGDRMTLQHTVSKQNEMMHNIKIKLHAANTDPERSAGLAG